jgi:glycosyltransferase involved in cell wall biosynthesis
MTTVSVIIPCYNHANFLADAIKSVRTQRWPATEIIVVDDGSTDGSSSVAAQFPEVRLIRQPNRGLSAARNAGLAACRGDVLIFLDADDVLLPDSVEAAVRALESNPDAMMVFGQVEYMHENGRPMEHPIPTVSTNFYEEFLRRNYIRMPGMAAFRRAVFELLGGFDPACSPTADYDLYLRIMRRFPVAVHEAHVARYRQHAANMSKNGRLMLASILKVLKRHRRTIRHDPALYAAYRDGLQRCRLVYGERIVEQFRRALRTGRGFEAIGCGFDLLRLYPRGVTTHLMKKLSLTFGHAGRAAPDADTAAPSARASAWPGSR